MTAVMLFSMAGIGRILYRLKKWSNGVKFYGLCKQGAAQSVLLFIAY